MGSGVKGSGVKDNYRSKYRTLEQGKEDEDPGLKCEYCDVTSSERDSQAHCLQCTAWSPLREDLDLSFMEYIVTYFRRVLKARGDQEEEERKRRKMEREEEEKRAKENIQNKRRRGEK